jgi:hypothetical protein
MIDGPVMIGLLAVGLVGGIAGGMLGIGGSVLFIPVLTVILGTDYHTSIAATLVVNVCVGFSAARGHLRSGLVRLRLLRLMAPVAVAAAVVGVLVSNLFTDDQEVVLHRLFGATMVYVILVNVDRMLRRRWSKWWWLPWQLLRWKRLRLWMARRGRKPRRSRARIAGVGVVTGLAVGLLGTGGGSVAVPAQQTLLGMRLRTAVANSSVALIFACAVAAVVKHLTLPAGLDPVRPWTLVGLLAPTAILGAPLGAYLTRRVNREIVRVVFMAFLAWTAYKMLM